MNDDEKLTNKLKLFIDDDLMNDDGNLTHKRQAIH
jgi:hypothetical protein